MANMKYLSTPAGILKIVEILLTSVAIGLRVNSAYLEGVDVLFFSAGVLTTCMIMTPLLLLCYIAGKTEIQKTVLEFLLNIILGVFLLSCAAKAFEIYSSFHCGVYKFLNVRVPCKTRNIGIAYGCFCIFDCIAYAIDAFFALKAYKQ